MDYFKINYSKLYNMPIFKYHYLIYAISLSLLIVIIFSFKVDVYKTYTTYGIYNDNVLYLKIHNKLSDKLNNAYIMFENKKFKVKVHEYLDYELISNEVYQNISIIIDKDTYDNQVVKTTIYYDKEKIYKHILDLFK